MATAGNTAQIPVIPGSPAVPVELARFFARTERAAALTVRATIYFALILVPLLIISPDAMFGYADVPKIATVRVLAAVIAIAWLAHAAAGSVISGRGLEVPALFRGARWITFSAAAFLLIALISSAVSVSQATAFRGAYPGFDSTDLYSLGSYALIGMAAARFLRSRRDMELALWSLALAGGLASIYGIAQFAGIDPFHFDRFEVNEVRTPLTFGNPGFAGSFLVISLFASVGLFFLQARPFSRPGMLAFAAIMLQVVALGTAASRGSWVGAGFGALIFAVVMLMSYRRSGTATPWRHVAMLGIPAVLALVTGFMLVAGGSESNGAGERLQSFNGGVLESGLNGRQATWTATLEMLEERPWVQGEPSNTALRHIFGYGPDSYRYAYQLVAPDEHVDRFVPHAHNSFMNVATEMGVAGLIAWTALTFAVVVTGVSTAWDRKTSPWTRAMAASLTAAFVAHGVDQLANVPRAADSLAMWVLVFMVGALAVMSRSGRLKTAGTPVAISGADQTKRENPSVAALAAPVVAVIVIAVIASVTILGNAGHLLADRAAANLQADMFRGALVSDLLETADRASKLTGDVAYYHTLEAMALDTASQVTAANQPLSRQLAARSLDALEAATTAAPLSPSENLSYARALLTAGMVPAAVESYERAVALSPRFWVARLELASAYAEVGRLEDGLFELNTAEALISRQADVTRFDHVNLERFAAVRAALGVERS